MDEQRVRSIIESILFVSDRPIQAREIAEILGEGFDTKTVKKILEDMTASYENSKGGIMLREVASGYQLYTNPENAEYLKKMIDIKPFKLSRASLETLAIVAYRQPVTKAEIEEIRGVDCSGALRVLIEKKLVRIVGKKDEPGRPFLYGTTKEFLEFFDLKSLADLPTLKDLEQIKKEINEESGVAYTQSSQSDNKAEESTSRDETAVQKVVISESEEDKEELKEEEVAQNFDEALKRIEETNKVVSRALGLEEKKGEGEVDTDNKREELPPDEISENKTNSQEKDEP
jgi:segregation and condensation protein B